MSDTTSTTSSASESVIIVGAGLAGAKSAEALRSEGFAGPIVLIGDEAHLPYERPPLSKGFLIDGTPQHEFTVHDRDWYDAHRVELRLGVAVTAVDTGERSVTLADGEKLTYSSLILATGSRSAVPPFEGREASGVHYLRSIDDASRLADELVRGARLVIIGAGWIGLEVAAAAMGRGCGVTIIEAGTHPLHTALGDELGEVFADLHRQRGVHFHFGVRVESIATEGGRATGVQLAGGEVVGADVVLVAVGARPNVEILEGTEVTVVDGGVRVDAGLRTAVANVYAVGDIAAVDYPMYGRYLRTEHWATALNQPAVAAATICGREAVYDKVPYFFTDQYDLGMEFRGVTSDYTRVVYRGDVKGLQFLAFWLDDTGIVLAAMNVNIWDAGDQLDALVAARVPVDADALADSDTPLDTLVP
ncbi:NAD(P)/FAD-dependent oxidoreductase [Dietzia sp. ANT_WB102]|uniref:NAD(P)/FAD-dependent oxidoreductase n=1 Tax=Dietzia sp. ANT_WB102 TaxID=2597345 RepID=UPI0011EDCC99|nr:FAD-dependent oxidoreductase [Dietzia sp. ANT_WB102]KAA0918012.1 NAD(P)/FAD-dependent oxidoreductase [Dietzia sp. ANT_WB102]